MASKDYVSRGSKKKKQPSRSGLLILIALLVIIGFAMALYLLKEKTPEAKTELAVPTEKEAPKAVLPTPPKEVWSYIKALETRIVPVDDKALDRDAQLTEEQKKVLIQMEKEQREAEIARSKQAQEQLLNEEQQVDIAVEERDELEERRKAAAERKRQEEQQMVLEQKKAEEKAKEERRRAEQAKNEVSQAKPVTSERQFGLQCGAFKNREQAETVQARLAMSGFNARLTTSADWNRVIIGPVGNRNEANQALSKAKSVTNCVLIAM